MSDYITTQMIVFFLAGAAGGFIGRLYEAYVQEETRWGYIAVGAIVKALMGGLMGIVVNHAIQYAILAGISVDAAHRHGGRILKRFFRE